mmetsp:Transcript_1047/g.4105  ORF Transcript_1047/g.4105 Transcript_1047/m.4105 type:complete len:303 (+) Transcript_1047:2294-3202(+)
MAQVLRTHVHGHVPRVGDVLHVGAAVHSHDRRVRARPEAFRVGPVHRGVQGLARAGRVVRRAQLHDGGRAQPQARDTLDRHGRLVDEQRLRVRAGAVVRVGECVRERVQRHARHALEAVVHVDERSQGVVEHHRVPPRSVRDLPREGAGVDRPDGAVGRFLVQRGHQQVHFERRGHCRHVVHQPPLLVHAHNVFDHILAARQLRHHRAVSGVLIQMLEARSLRAPQEAAQLHLGGPEIAGCAGGLRAGQAVRPVQRREEVIEIHPRRALLGEHQPARARRGVERQQLEARLPPILHLREQHP